MSARFDRSDVFAAATFVTLVTAVWLATSIVVLEADRPRTDWEQKLATAERRIHYRLSERGGVTLDLRGGEEEVRLILHAVAPRELPFDPRREVGFGVRVTLLEGTGRPVWTRDFVTRARQSKAARRDGFWLYENAFAEDLSIEVTDDRRFDVRLPGPAASDARLLVEHLGGAPAVFLSAYRRLPRSDAAQELRWRATLPHQRDAIAQRSSSVPWFQLAAADQRTMLGQFGDRLSATGEADRDFTTQTLLHTGFRLSVDQGELGAVVHRLRRAAFNVVGPARLTMRLQQHPDEASVAPTADEQIVVEDVTEEPVRVSLTAPIPVVPDVGVHIVDVPAGLHSLVVRTDSLRRVQVELTAPPGPRVQFGDLAAVVEGGDDVERHVRVDTREVATYVLEPDGLPVVAAIEEVARATSGIDGRLLRVDVRALPGPDGKLPTQIEIVARVFGAPGADGVPQPVTTLRQQVQPLAAPFDRLRPSDEQPPPAGIDRFTEDLLAEAQPLNFVLPVLARRVEVTCAARAAVRLQVPMPLADETLQQPYRSATLSTLRWEHAPLEAEPWTAVRAENHDDLAVGGQGGKLVLTVRLVPRDVRVAGGDRESAALVVRGLPPQQRVLEPVSEEHRSRALERWAPGTYAMLRPAAAARVDVGRVDGVAPHLRYFVDKDVAGALGQPVFVYGDDNLLGAFVVGATRGAWRLPLRERAPKTLRIEAPPALRVLVDQPPASGASAELYRAATVVRVGREPVEVVVPVVDGDPAPVNLVLYAPRAAADERVQIEAVLDDGVPEIRPGVAFARVTPSRKTATLPASARSAPAILIDDVDEGPLFARTVVFPIEADLAPGDHTLRVRVTGRDGLWARFFVLRPSTSMTEQASQFRTTPTGTLAASTTGAAPMMPAPSGLWTTEGGQGGARCERRTMTVDDAVARIWPRTSTVRFRPSTSAERYVVGRLVSLLAKRPDDADLLVDLARSVGFALERWSLPAGEFVALVEPSDQQRGAGAYFFRVATAQTTSGFVLQAPHAYHDIGSGTLGARVFFEDQAGPAAFFTNTVHRYQTEDGAREKRTDAPADVCHNADHVFSAATAAWANGVEHPLVVQLHAFGDSDERTAAGVTAVVSAGRIEGSTTRSAAFAAALRGVLGDGVRRFPEQTDELGATTNAQARLLRRLPRADFVHVELSPTARQVAGDDIAGLRAALRGAAAR
jgi:hypothetical protein